METIQDTLSQAVANFDTLSFLKIMLLLSAGCFLLGILLRIICGKRSSLNKSVGAALGILMIYVASIALYSIDSHYKVFLAPLPFVSMADDCMTIFVLKGAGFPAVCTELVNMIILAFIIGLIDDLVPDGKNFFTWYFFRCVSVVLGIAAHWGINWLFTTYMPGFIVTYAPIVLLALIVLLLAVSVFKLIIGALLGVTLGPVVGAIYTFFFSHVVGKQISRATLTTMILTAIVAVLNHFGITVIYLGSAFIAAFLPAFILVIIVWYLVIKFL